MPGMMPSRLPVRTRRRIWPVVLIVAVIATGGGGAAAGVYLGTHGGQPVAQVSPAPSGPSSPLDSPSPVKIYADAMDLVRDLNAAGLPCGPATRVVNPRYAATLVDCGKTIVVATYPDYQSATNAYLQLRDQINGTDIPIHMAIGSNWTVNSDDPTYAEQVARLFHATYVTA